MLADNISIAKPATGTRQVNSHFFLRLFFERALSIMAVTKLVIPETTDSKHEPIVAATSKGESDHGVMAMFSSMKKTGIDTMAVANVISRTSTRLFFCLRGISSML